MDSICQDDSCLNIEVGGSWQVLFWFLGGGSIGDSGDTAQCLQNSPYYDTMFLVR